MFRERHSYSLRSGKRTVISERTMLQDIAVVVLLLPVATTGLLLDSLEYRNCSTPLGNAPLDNEASELASSHCPPWFTNETGKCRPGPKLGGIIQQDLLDLQTSLQECYCMTEDSGALVVGGCMYTCKAVMGYYPLPCHVSQVNDFTCAGLHRRGKLCGMCEDGYAIPVYSYDLGCVKCDNYKYNWLKYSAVAFLPLTIFYILVTLFSISFTSPLLTGLVMAFQILGHPIQAQLFLSFAKSSISLIEPRILKALLSIASFWNLDFFRLYYSFCLHPDASAMAIMALDYATTVYPVILIGLTYVLVKLYDHNLKLLVWPWKLLSVFLKPLRRHWDVRTSLVDVFASFIYLSSTRLLVTSMKLLVPITSYTYKEGPDGHMKLSTVYYLYSSPSVKYFGKTHLPFAIMAILLLFVFFLLPMALLLFSWFQKILNHFRFNSLALNTFVEVVQGPFKDGTNRTRDYRFFSGFLLLMLLVCNFTYVLTLSSMYYPVASIWILIYLTLHLVFRPYKRSLHNFSAIVALVCLLLFYWGMTINCAVVSVSMNIALSQHPNTYKGFWMVSIILFALSILSLFIFHLCLGVLALLRVFKVMFTKRDKV